MYLCTIKEDVIKLKLKIKVVMIFRRIAILLMFALQSKINQISIFIRKLSSAWWGKL